MGIGATVGLAADSNNGWVVGVCFGLPITALGVWGIGAAPRKLTLSPTALVYKSTWGWAAHSRHIAAEAIVGVSPRAVPRAGCWVGDIVVTCESGPVVIQSGLLRARRGEIGRILRTRYGEGPEFCDLQRRLSSPEAASLAMADLMSIPITWKAADWATEVMAWGFVLVGISALVGRAISFLSGGYPRERMLLGVVASAVMLLPLLVLLWALVGELVRGGPVRTVEATSDRLRIRRAFRDLMIPTTDVLGVSHSGAVNGKGRRSFVRIFFRQGTRVRRISIPADRVDLPPDVLAGALLHRFGEFLPRRVGKPAK